MRNLIAATNEALARRGVPLSGDPKRSLPRINRDVRFSKDKSPYKAYVSATFMREPCEMSPGRIYLQLSPGECFAGAGFFMLERDNLAAKRAAIVARADDWLGIKARLEAAGHPVGGEDSFMRMPRGFEAQADAATADALRWRGHTCKMMLAPGAAQAPDLPKRIADFAARSLPLLQFGWDALRIGSEN